MTRTFEVTLAFDAPDDVTILPGMTARVVADALTAADGAGLMVPVEAVFSDSSSKSFVWVVGGDMKVARRQVACGALAGGGIAVTSGLEPGEEIAVSGIAHLRDGMSVRRFDARKV